MPVFGYPTMSNIYWTLTEVYFSPFLQLLETKFLLKPETLYSVNVTGSSVLEFYFILVMFLRP